MRVAALVVLSVASVFAQQKPVTIPLIGCASDGQVGPVGAPTPGAISLPLSASAGNALAYYRSGQGLGVLAPRGWFCFGSYGANGEELLVTPRRVSRTKVFPDLPIIGPAIQVVHSDGETPGRDAVARVIARVFPAYRSFATGVAEEFETRFQFGPYPNDALTYKSKSVVEYKTPALIEGLGTMFGFNRGGDPICGVAMLVGDTPDLVHLSVRLPRDMTDLAPAIVRETERDLGPRAKVSQAARIKRRHGQ